MAVIKTGPTISKIAGRSGDHVYSSWRGKQYLRSKSSSRSNPSSSRQATARAGATALSKAWTEDLTDGQKALWEELAAAGSPTLDPASSREQGSRVIIPQPKPVLSGYDAFIRHNQRAILTGLTPFGSPYLTPVHEFPNPVNDLEYVTIPPLAQNFALSFDGVNEHINLGDVLDYEYTAPQTWEMWLWTNNTVTPQGLVFKYVPTPTFLRGYGMRIDADFLYWYLEYEPANDLIMVRRVFTTTGAWVHLVFTYNGNNQVGGLRIFVNSVVGQVNFVNFPITASIVHASPLGFGRRFSATDMPLNGSLCCMRNFNKDILQPGVNTLFAGGAGVFGPDPLGDGSCQGAWMFCTGGGNTLFDISGNNYHGTLVNMEPGDWIIGHVPCPSIPGYEQVQWTPPTVPVGSKVRIWLQSYDANVHKQHVATVDSGVGFWIPDTVRVAQGAEVPIASMPGHYLIQADIISPGGNQSPPSNTIEITIP